MRIKRPLYLTLFFVFFIAHNGIAQDNRPHEISSGNSDTSEDELSRDVTQEQSAEKAINDALISSQQSPSDEAEQYAKELIDDIPIKYLRQLSDVFTHIKLGYVEEVDNDKLLESAIVGMMYSLDDYSVYLNEEDFTNFRSDTEGEFAGIGIDLVRKDNVLRILSPIDDTPAQRAGILSGDIITHINDVQVNDIEGNVFEKFKGEAGTDITLTLLREGVDDLIEVTMTRAIIRVKSVKHETIEPGYGYIRISQFQEDTASSLRQALTQLLHQNNNELKGLVFDLRNNPGGILGSAVDVSNIFLNDGTIVTIKDRYGRINDDYKATAPDLLSKTKIVVLINNGSASAAEIVSGALQVNNRATLLGETTFGKGSVQTVKVLNLSAAIKLTTAKYYLGNGESIHKVGVKPDVVIDRDAIDVDYSSKPIAEQHYVKEAMKLLLQ